MTWRLERLDPAVHRDEVLGVLEASEDFARLSEGRPASRETVEDFFAATPPNRDPSESLKLGVRADDERLIGVLDIARGFPDSATWYLGLLLLIPSERENGMGREIVAEVLSRARAEGARRLRLAVLEENARAVKFWGAQDFVEIQRYPPRQFGLRFHGRVEMELALGGEAQSFEAPPAAGVDQPGDCA